MKRLMPRLWLLLLLQSWLWRLLLPEYGILKGGFVIVEREGRVVLLLVTEKRRVKPIGGVEVVVVLGATQRFAPEPREWLLFLFVLRNSETKGNAIVVLVVVVELDFHIGNVRRHARL